MRAIGIKDPGGPEKLYIGDVPRPEPKDGEVLINVHATALNRADLLQSEILGLVSAELLGWEIVMALLSGGGYVQYAAVPEELLMPVPMHLTLCEAAAIPEAWLTAYQLLHFIGQVKPGEMVLIHAGVSGVSMAAIQLACLSCPVPIVTAGSLEKLKMALQLHAAAGFNYKVVDFSEKILQFTEGKGADIILDCIGGTSWEKTVHSFAMDGRWVLYGTMGGRPVEGDLLGKLLFKRGHILSTELVRSFSKQVLPHFQSRGLLSTGYSTWMTFLKHTDTEANKNIGKIVIKTSESLYMSIQCLQVVFNPLQILQVYTFGVNLVL
uniref:Enoyl reductase (ER) domain-containing protein n=1 Tax=Electrophorus electricus TaxID=8005 RepID=A0A4W4F9K7_ELEEL